MPKDITVKDVLYALEYLHDQMVRSAPNGGKAKWSMQGTGATVKDSIANEVRASGAVVAFEDHGCSIVTWRRAA